jgi:hypothetical protein
MRKLAALILAAAVVAGVAGCTPPHRDSTVPASSDSLAACPHGDAGRIKDAWLQPPDWWVCVSG